VRVTNITTAPTKEAKVGNGAGGAPIHDFDFSLGETDGRNSVHLFKAWKRSEDPD